MKHIAGSRHFSSDEWFFKSHWPGHPNVPGVLQLERLTQTAGMLLFLSRFSDDKYFLLHVVQELKLHREILPDSTLDIFCSVESVRRAAVRFSAEGKVSGLLAVRDRFDLVCPSLLVAPKSVAHD